MNQHSKTACKRKCCVTLYSPSTSVYVDKLCIQTGLDTAFVYWCSWMDCFTKLHNTVFHVWFCHATSQFLLNQVVKECFKEVIKQSKVKENISTINLSAIQQSRYVYVEQLDSRSRWFYRLYESDYLLAVLQCIAIASKLYHTAEYRLYSYICYSFIPVQGWYRCYYTRLMWSQGRV